MHESKRDFGSIHPPQATGEERDFFSKDDHDLLRVRLPPHVRRWGSVRYDLKKSGSDSITSRKKFIAKTEEKGSGRNKII